MRHIRILTGNLESILATLLSLHVVSARGVLLFTDWVDMRVRFLTFMGLLINDELAVLRGGRRSELIQGIEI